MTKKRLINDLINRSKKIKLPSENIFTFVNHRHSSHNSYYFIKPCFSVDSENNLFDEIDLNQTLSKYLGIDNVDPYGYVKAWQSKNMPDGIVFDITIGSENNSSREYMICISDSNQEHTFFDVDHDNLLGFISGKFRLLAYAKGDKASKLKDAYRPFRYSNDPESLIILSKLIHEGGFITSEYKSIINQIKSGVN
jgi:hypothetical protein